MKNKELLDYFFEINKIKDVKRYSIYHEVFKESVADHSFLMTVLATKFVDELKLDDLDFKKVIKLIMHHDFGEIGMVADFNTSLASVDKAYSAHKETVELENINALSNKHGKEIFDLYNEYTAQQTREAKFVKALDKLEATIYIMMRGAEYLTDAHLAAIFPIEAVKNFPELIPFLKELQTHMKLEYTKAGHEWKKEYEI